MKGRENRGGMEFVFCPRKKTEKSAPLMINMKLVFLIAQGKMPWQPIFVGFIRRIGFR